MAPRRKRRGTSGERTLARLADKLFFAPEEGRIWFDDQRMLLFHAGALGALRREVIHALGVERGRELLERVGYVQGTRDAELIRRHWPQYPAGLHSGSAPDRVDDALGGLRDRSAAIGAPDHRPQLLGGQRAHPRGSLRHLLGLLHLGRLSVTTDTDVSSRQLYQKRSC